MTIRSNYLHTATGNWQIVLLMASLLLIPTHQECLPISRMGMIWLACFPVTIARWTRESCCIWCMLWAKVTPMLMSELWTVILPCLPLPSLTNLGSPKLWIGVGTGKRCRDIPILDIKSALGPTRLLALPLFHSLSSCDTTSQLLGMGKKTACSTLQSTLSWQRLNLTHDPHTFNMDTDDMKQLERFTVLMYSRGCNTTFVNEARLQLFPHGSRTLEALPSTKVALYQHVKGAIRQGEPWVNAGWYRQV